MTRLIVVVAAALAALGAGRGGRIATASGGVVGNPVRLGPIVTLATGPGWAYTAWISDMGICTHFRDPWGGGGGGCGAGVVGAPPDLLHREPAPTRMIACDVGDNDTFKHPRTPSIEIDCVASASVVRIRVLLRSGKSLIAKRLPAKPALKTSLRFFLLPSIPIAYKLHFRSGHLVLPWQVVLAYDSRSVVIDRQAGTA